MDRRQSLPLVPERELVPESVPELELELELALVPEPELLPEPESESALG